MNLIFSYSPSLKNMRLFARNDDDNKAKEKMQENILTHRSDEIIIELDWNSEIQLKELLE